MVRPRRHLGAGPAGDRAVARRWGGRRVDPRRSRRATTACRTASSSGRSSPPASPSSTPASSPASAGSSAAAVRRGSWSPRPVVIALALEPGRHHVRGLVDRLVYGVRDDPLAVVQRVVDHLGADSGDDLLPRSSPASSASCASTPWRSTCGCPVAGSAPPRSDRRRRTGVSSSCVTAVTSSAASSSAGRTARRCASATRRCSTSSPGRSAWPSAGCGSPATCADRAWPSCRRARRNGAGCAATSTTGSGRR